MDSEPQNVNPSVVESAKTRVQNLPDSSSSTELSAHQMPGILQAERSSFASSAFQFGGTTLDPWEQASRESYNSLVDGGLLPEGYRDMFVNLALKAASTGKDSERIATLSPMELGQESREAQAASLRVGEEDSHRTARACQRSGPKEGQDEAGDDEILWSPLLDKTQSGQRKVDGLLTSPLSSWVRKRLLDNGSWRNRQRATAWDMASGLGTAQPCSRTASVLLLARHPAPSSVPVC